MTSPNLVPLQLDQTTGNLVAKTLAGTYVPPSGTGFQFVTNGAPSTAAVTATQATALLNLFTSSLQGLVPASAGGTTNYLRADGTWAAPPGVGTVTSVALADGSTTALYNVTGSPVTGSGTLTFTLKTQTANFVLAGPTTGSAAQPAFRALVAADIPTISLTSGVSGALQAAQFPALTGDVTTTAGALATTLATVNANVGTWNTLTVNGKGLVTAGSNTAYLTANQTITISGDISGTGSQAITATLPNIATPGTYTSVTVNAKGQVTAGTSPTTLTGYGITNGVSTSSNTTMASGISITFQGGGTVTGLATPQNATDAATMSYVQSTRSAVVASTTTASYVETVTSGQKVLLANATSAAITVTLPAAGSSTGFVYTVKKTDSSANDVTVSVASTDRIDGNSTVVLGAQYQYVTIVGDGTNWNIIGAGTT